MNTLYILFCTFCVSITDTCNVVFASFSVWQFLLFCAFAIV